MSQAFGSDFSKVRIHTGHQANTMNVSIGARAFSHGTDIYFSNGQYNPVSNEGKKLLAHELTHVVQQNKGHAAIQRPCGYDEIGERSSCTFSEDEGYGEPYFFVANCDDFVTYEEYRLEELAADLGLGTYANVHGFASIDGPKGFNDPLSCERAEKAKEIFEKSGVEVMELFYHGGIPGDRSEKRKVEIEIVIHPVSPVENNEDPQKNAVPQCPSWEDWVGHALGQPELPDQRNTCTNGRL